METYKDYLAHHGIKGMKWNKLNGPPYPLSDEQRSAEENRKNPTSKSAKEKYGLSGRKRKVSGTASSSSMTAHKDQRVHKFHNSVEVKPTMASKEDLKIPSSALEKKKYGLSGRKRKVSGTASSSSMSVRKDEGSVNQYRKKEEDKPLEIVPLVEEKQEPSDKRKPSYEKHERLYEEREQGAREGINDALKEEEAVENLEYLASTKADEAKEAFEKDKTNVLKWLASDITEKFHDSIADFYENEEDRSKVRKAGRFLASLGLK